MELKEFISETLKQIVEGLIDVQKYVKENEYKSSIVPIDYHNWDKIEFDVAVTSDESESATAGAGITVASIFKAKGEIETGNREQNISRVKFQVPISFPKQCIK